MTADLLTRIETKDLLKISLGTLTNWQNKGILKAYGIGRRTYFKKSEVEQALQPLKTLSNE